MNKSILCILVFFNSAIGVTQNWKPVGDKIKTPWAVKVDPDNPLPEYPRPMIEREHWQSLNGL